VSDTVLQEGQVLLEAWHVEFKCVSRRRPPSEWVECRVVKMYHGTIYGGANGVGKTVDEARLEAVLGLARAICDDFTAFDHDADEIFKAEQHRWWLSKLQECRESLEFGEGTPKSARKLKRRIRQIEQLMGEWQEEHDYWPEAEDADQEARSKARAAQIRADTSKRRAASARIAEVAARASSVGGTVAS
jgi:hypothetical protein